MLWYAMKTKALYSSSYTDQSAVEGMFDPQIEEPRDCDSEVAESGEQVEQSEQRVWQG
jgi:hypothetical protein